MGNNESSQQQQQTTLQDEEQQQQQQQYHQDHDEHQFDGIETVGYRVLGVQPNSPASNAGLVSFLDFIVGANGRMLFGTDREDEDQEAEIDQLLGISREEIERDARELRGGGGSGGDEEDGRGNGRKSDQKKVQDDKDDDVDDVDEDIVDEGEEYFVDIDFPSLLKANVDQEVELLVWNIKSQTQRIVTITPTTKWGGTGLLGVTIRMDDYHEADLRILRVLSVEHRTSPASIAGLTPERDYLLGTAETAFSSEEDLARTVQRHVDRVLECYVYNSDSDIVRVVTLVPTLKWGGDAIGGRRRTGLLGMEVGRGYLHRIPHRCRGTNGRSLERRVRLHSSGGGVIGASSSSAAVASAVSINPGANEKEHDKGTYIPSFNTHNTNSTSSSSTTTTSTSQDMSHKNDASSFTSTSTSPKLQDIDLKEDPANHHENHNQLITCSTTGKGASFEPMMEMEIPTKEEQQQQQQQQQQQKEGKEMRSNDKGTSKDAAAITPTTDNNAITVTLSPNQHKTLNLSFSEEIAMAANARIVKEVDTDQHSNTYSSSVPAAAGAGAGAIPTTTPTSTPTPTKSSHFGSMGLNLQPLPSLSSPPPPIAATATATATTLSPPYSYSNDDIMRGVGGLPPPPMTDLGD